MDKKQILDRRRKCPFCKANKFVCGINPLHVMFKYIQYTKEGRDAWQYYKNEVYTWFYDGINGTNNGKVDYVRQAPYYEGLIYSLGQALAKKA